MAKFLSSNIRLATNQEAEFGSTGQRHLIFDGTHLRVLGGTFTIGAAGAGISNILDEDAMGSDSAVSLATQQSIKAYVDARVNGLDWQESVLDIVDNTAVPPPEVSGDRYILDATGASHANWDGAAAWDVVEFNGTTWDVVYDASADEGGAAWVEDVNNQYVHNGTAWVLLSSIVGGITAGTVANRTLRWSGTAWVESAALTNNDTDITATGDMLISGGDLTLGVATSQLGTLILAGSTSGTLSITTAVAAGGTWTFPNPATGGAGALYTTAGGTISSGDLPIADGGTGQSAAIAAFNALGPCTTTGDIIYANAAATQTRLGVGSNGDVLTLAGGIPSWAAAGAHAASHSDGGSDEMTVENLATAGAVDQVLQGDGLGGLAWGDNCTLAGELRLVETAATTDYVGFVAPAALAASTTYTLPTAFPGTSGFHLASTDAGVLSWADAGDVIPDSTVVGSILIGSGPGDWVEDVAIRGAAGALSLGTASATGSSIVFYNAVNANTVTIQSGTTSGTYALTLPLAVAGTTGDVLASTDAGVLSWVTPYAEVMTTRGDMLFRNAANATARLPVGNAGEYIKTDGTDASWGPVVAADVDITDADGHYTGTQVEAALDEIGDELFTADGNRKHGRFSIADATGSAVIDFAPGFTDMASTSYTLTYSLLNTTDGTPASYGMVTTAKATTGFTVLLSGNTDSANYDLEWVAIHD